MLCFSVGSCFLFVCFPSHKGPESNGYHWQFGKMASKVAGGAGLLPDLTLNLFVGYMPVQVV